MKETNNQEIQDNKLIAEFMGYEHYGWNDPNHRCPDYTSGYWGKKDHKSHHLKLQHLGMMFNPLQYHSSWDWLMPVVENRRFKSFIASYLRTQNT